MCIQRNAKSQVACALLLAAVFPQTSPAQRSLEYPRTNRVDQVDDYHGTSVADPYRWLENDVRISEEVAAWVEAQNRVTGAYLDSIEAREQIIERLTQLWNFARYEEPGLAGGRYFYSKNDGLQDQSVLYVADAFDAEGRPLIDPNEWSVDGTVALAGYQASHDGNWLAYQRSEAGSDWRTIHILNVDSGEHSAEELRWVRFSPIHWSHDDRGFYYNRYPEPREGEEYQSVALNQTVYFHRLGSPQSEDRLVYHRPDHPEWHFLVEPSDDGQFLWLVIEKSTDAKNQLYYRSIEGADSDWLPLIQDFKDQFSPIGNMGRRLFLFTDFEAPTKRIVTMDLDQPGRDGVEEIVPACESTLESVNLIDRRLVAAYLQDVLSRVSVYSLDGQFERDVSLPGVGSASGFAGRPNDTETFFTFTSFNTPASTYRYDMRSGETTLIRRPEVDFDPEDYAVRQVFYVSQDGTRVPMFVAHRDGLELNGANPTLLYGYGGFAVPLTPYFSVSRLAFMEMGGVIAVANLRGGGEYGEDWHLAGKLENKQNVFDDFIAAAEWLIKQRYTQPSKLAIQGGSNGGLLVGAVMTQRPDLFAACLPAVGVMDMLRFDAFTAGRFWTEEYGSANDPNQFENLLAYSPYHNVRPGTKYPATLVTTADTDDRVVPMHSFKFAAALQHAQAGDAPVLIRIETRAGHGRGTPTTKLIEQTADLWAFLVENLEMKVGE